MIKRHKTIAVNIGCVRFGADAPPVVQSMTNTDTADVDATVRQVCDLANSGSELVRVTVNSDQAAAAVPKIIDHLDKQGVSVPIIGDFHYNGHRLLAKHPDCAARLSKYRINPGNVGHGSKRDSQFAQMIELACRHDKLIRIGVNWGSLDQALLADMLDANNRKSSPLPLKEITRNALVESALDSAIRAEQLGLAHDRIVLSCKVSEVQSLISVYRDLASRCDYPLHIGLTEAGMGNKGIVSSTAALAILLQQGIGDTIRVSLTPRPGGDRCEEVRVAQEILQSMGIRSFIPRVISCPGCGRTSSDYFQQLAADVEEFLRSKMPQWKHHYPGVEEMSVAVMGCVVNGPGESKNAQIGISLPGAGERPAAPVYENGNKTVTLKGDQITDDFKQRIETYVNDHYGDDN